MTRSSSTAGPPASVPAPSMWRARGRWTTGGAWWRSRPGATSMPPARPLRPTGSPSRGSVLPMTQDPEYDVPDPAEQSGDEPEPAAPERVRTDVTRVDDVIRSVEELEERP